MFFDEAAEKLETLVTKSKISIKRNIYVAENYGGYVAINDNSHFSGNEAISGRINVLEYLSIEFTQNRY